MLVKAYLLPLTKKTDEELQWDILRVKLQGFKYNFHSNFGLLEVTSVPELVQE